MNPITPLILAFMFPVVNAVLVERSRDLTSLTSTANSASSTSNRSTPGGAYTARATWFYIVIVGAVLVFIASVAICFLRACCGLCKGGNTQPVQNWNHIIVPVYEQPQVHNVPHPFAPGGGYQGPYNPQVEQYRTGPYPLAYTPVSAGSPAPFETGPTGNHQPNQPPYNPNQQFQGR